MFYYNTKLLSRKEYKYPIKLDIRLDLKRHTCFSKLLILLNFTIRKLQLKINLFLLKYLLPIFPSFLLAIKKLMQNNIPWYTFPRAKHILPSLTYVSDGCCFSNHFLPLDFLTRRERGHIGHCHEMLQFRIDAILRREFHKKGNFPAWVESSLSPFM